MHGTILFRHFLFWYFCWEIFGQKFSLKKMEILLLEKKLKVFLESFFFFCTEISFQKFWEFLFLNVFWEIFSDFFSVVLTLADL